MSSKLGTLKCPFGCGKKNMGRAGYNIHIGKCNVGRAQEEESSREAARRMNEEAVQRMTAERAAAEQAAQPETAVEFTDQIIVDEPDAPPTPPSLYRASGLPNRRIRPTQKIRDSLPEPIPLVQLRVPVPDPPPDLPHDPVPPPVAHPADVPLPRMCECVITRPNAYGVYKVFAERPTHDPDRSVKLRDVCDAPELVVAPCEPLKPEPRWYHPFKNPSIALEMMHQILDPNPQSNDGRNTYIHGVLRDPEFNTGHFENFDNAKQLDILDKFEATPIGEPPNGWRTASVKLKLPCPKNRILEGEAPEVEIDGLHYRPLLDVMKEMLQGPAFEQFHTTPFLFRCDPGYDPTAPFTPIDTTTVELDEHGIPVLPPGHNDLYSEVYTTQRMMQAHQKAKKLAAVAAPDSTAEPIVVSFMPQSDATHLASFGDAMAWPCYMYFGGHSKHLRGKPSANAGWHQAYFPSIPDRVNDIYRENFGIDMPDYVVTHLKRELMHAVWDVMLDEEFVKVYREGLELVCYDKIPRRAFPWLFTYGADYPEKVLLATIKNLGRRPCPRCFVLKIQIPMTGSKPDMKLRQNVRTVSDDWLTNVDIARRAIFDLGHPITGNTVDLLLKENSWVPTRNAFAKLANVGLGLNVFQLFVPDVLHEVELGVVKAIFTHIIRLLFSCEKGAVSKLDERFRDVPTFGRMTIRKFHRNVSEMKRLAARDFEDTLQCLPPVIEGLFTKINSLVLDVSFDLAAFHAMAKLRLHSTTTIKDFRGITSEMCKTVRKFQRDTKNIKTYETPREKQARDNRATAIAKQAAYRADANSASERPQKRQKTDVSTSTRKEKKLNLETYKFHSTADYPDAVLTSGPLDNHTTQHGEQKHKSNKVWYALTNKRNHIAQMTKRERRIRLMRAMELRRKQEHNRRAKADALAAGAAASKDHTPGASEPAPPSISLREALRPKKRHDMGAFASPNSHYSISASQRTSWDLSKLPGSLDHDSDSDTEDEEDLDPAFKNFTFKLKTHLRHRLLGITENRAFTREELTDVHIEDSRIYSHATMKLNYTTYDMRRDQDTINPRTRADIMVLSGDESDAHPYEYARVVGIFHARVHIVGSGKAPEKMFFLWVRWFALDKKHRSGWKAKRLHRVRFIAHDDIDLDTFTFIDPSNVVRGSHLIPAFHYGRTRDLLPLSIVRRVQEGNKDWNYLYINFFVDRDMFMRYRTGQGVGHQSAKEAAPVPPHESAGDEESREDQMDDDSDVEDAQAANNANESDGEGEDSAWEDEEEDQQPPEEDEEAEELYGDEWELDAAGLTSF